MALLPLDASTPTKVAKTGAGNTATTASFTAPANALLIALWAQDQTGPVSTTIADSGGLTWTRIYRLCSTTSLEANTPTPTGTAQSGYISAWKATTSSSAARTVTVTQAGSGGTGKDGQLFVAVLKDTGGAPTVGAVATKGGSGSAPSHAFTSTAANSLGLAGSNDWNAGGTGTVGSGQTMLATSTSANDSQHAWRQTATTASSGTVVTMNLTAPGSQTWNIGVIEILANAGAGGSFSGSASLAATDTITATGQVGKVSSASIAATDTITATGVVGTASSASLAATGTVTATGVVGKSTGASLAATATITATGSVSGGAVSSSASLNATDTITATGVVGKSSGASLAGTAAVTATGLVGKLSGASLAATATITATGSVAVSGLSSSASLAATDTITATGRVGTSTGASLAATAAVTASGSVGSAQGASLAAVATITAAGLVELAAPPTLIFQTPTRDVNVANRSDFLWGRVSYRESLVVVKYLDGRFATRELFEPDEPGVEKVYMGGHVHTLTEAEAADLTAAGYGSYITEEA